MLTDVKRARPHQRYRLRDGAEVPGVTTVLGVLNKPALVTWANRMGLRGIDTGRYVDELATIGTLAHAIIIHSLGGPEPDFADHTANQRALAENAVLSFTAWRRGREMETVLAEVPLVSERYAYGGTPDWYGLVDGRRVLLDFKTGKAIYDEHLYQVAAYRGLLVENWHGVDEVRVLQVGRDEGEGFSERVILGSAIESYWRVFLAALRVRAAIAATRRGRDG